MPRRGDAERDRRDVEGADPLPPVGPHETLLRAAPRPERRDAEDADATAPRARAGWHRASQDLPAGPAEGRILAHRARKDAAPGRVDYVQMGEEQAGKGRECARARNGVSTHSLSRTAF